MHRSGEPLAVPCYVAAEVCYMLAREGAEALTAARVPDLSLPTLADGETWRDVRGFTPDITALAERGMAFEHLDQLALEHLYGVR